MEREVEVTPIGVPIFEVLEKVSPSVVATIPTLDIPTPPPPPPPPKDLVDKGLNDSQHPLYMRLRNRISWWEKYATPQVVHLITHGLPACWVKSLPRPKKVLNRPFQEVKDALEIMEEYLSVHAVRELELRLAAAGWLGGFGNPPPPPLAGWLAGAPLENTQNT